MLSFPSQLHCPGKPATGLLLHGGHEHGAGPGSFAGRDRPRRRDLSRRAFTVGVGGPVGSGKTALVLALCRMLRDSLSLAVVTNDIFTREDAEFLMRNEALAPDRIRAVETGGCPHAAIREDVTANLMALEALTELHHPELLFCESGGDNLAAHFSRELADYTIYVIDVAGGDKVPRIRAASRSITERSAPTAGARSVLLMTSRSDWVMPGPPLRGTLSPPATSIT